MNSLVLNKFFINVTLSPKFKFKSSFNKATNLIFQVMSSAKKPNYVAASNKIKTATKKEIKEGMRKLDEENKEVRRSFKTDIEAMSFRAGR